MNEGAAEWVTAREAIVATGVKRRTLYAWMESGRLPTKNVDGLTRVSLAAVQECMQVHDARTHRSGPHGAAHTRRPASAPFTPEDAKLLASKRARVDALELDRAATEAHDRLLDSRVDAGIAAGNRAARTAGAEVIVLRERLELEQVRWKQDNERRQAAARFAEQEAEAAKRAEADAREAEGHRVIKEREQRYIRHAADWVRRELGESVVLEARSCVRRVVHEFEPDEAEEVVAAVVKAALTDQFAVRIQTKRAKQQEFLRATTKLEILREVLLHGDAEEVRSAVEEALDRELAYTLEPEHARLRLMQLAVRVRENEMDARMTKAVLDLLPKIVLAVRGRR